MPYFKNHWHILIALLQQSVVQIVGANSWVAIPLSNCWLRTDDFSYIFPEPLTPIPWMKHRYLWYLFALIYTIILLKFVCRCSQTSGRNSCLIVSGDVSNCSYQLSVIPPTISHFSSAESLRECSVDWTNDRSWLIASNTLEWGQPEWRQLW